MAAQAYITKVAIVGASGNSGSYMASSLLATGRHTVTALTRAGSSAVIPAGLKVSQIKYDEPSTIVNALKGQDALIITLGVQAPKDTQTKLIEAAEEAGVKYVFPNEWSPDTDNEDLRKDIGSFYPKQEVRKDILSRGKIGFIGVTTGFWYEWSLAIPPSFGFDFAKKKVTFFDTGDQKISVSTWPHVGQAVAAILSLPIQSDSGLSLEKLKNKLNYISSFVISQRDMFESVLRVTGSKESDWTITEEPSHERYANALDAMKEGDMSGFIEMMYTRIFYPDGAGDFTAKGTIDQQLGLEREDLDEATKRAIQRSEEVKLWA